MTPYKFFLHLHGFLGLPLMTTYERQLYKKILCSFKSRPLRIFEYGTGFSTLHYARFLRFKGVDFQFYSVDNNLLWHRKISDKIMQAGLSDRVHLSVHSFDPFWAKPGWRWDTPPKKDHFSPNTKEERAYIQKPVEIGGDFDLVVVDGRFRQHCMRVARQVLGTRGIVMLHDAQKKHYSLPDNFMPYMHWIESGKFCPWKKEKARMLLGSKSPISVP